MGITLWEYQGMGIRLKLGNENGKEWEITAWEWEGMGM